MAPKASKPAGSASSPAGGGLNQVLARGKLLARIRKEKSEADERGEVYDYPPETPLLEDGTSDMTLGDLMATEKLSKKKAVKVMMKFRAEANASAKAEAASNPKALACLPEDAAPPSSSSKAVPKPKPLKIASKKSEERDEQGGLAGSGLDKASGNKHVPNKEQEEETSRGKKAKTKAAQACEEDVGNDLGKSKGRKRDHEPANNEQAAAAAEAADHTKKKKMTNEASAPIEVPDTQIDAAVDEQEGTDEATAAKKNKKRERDGNDAMAEKSKEKKEKKEKRKHARQVQEMIEEIETQMSAPEAEPTLEAMASVAGLPRALPSTRVTSKPPCPPATNEAPTTAAQEAASPTTEDHEATSGLIRTSSEDRQPDPTESELDTQHRTWSSGVHGEFGFLDLQHPAYCNGI